MKQAYKTLITVLLLVFSLLYAGPVLAETVTPQVGFKIGDEMTFNVSRTTRALNQGEYVMMEYRKTWRCYKVNQKYR